MLYSILFDFIQFIFSFKYVLILVNCFDVIIRYCWNEWYLLFLWWQAAFLSLSLFSLYSLTSWFSHRYYLLSFLLIYCVFGIHTMFSSQTFQCISTVYLILYLRCFYLQLHRQPCAAIWRQRSVLSRCWLLCQDMWRSPTDKYRHPFLQVFPQLDLFKASHYNVTSYQVRSHQIVWYDITWRHWLRNRIPQNSLFPYSSS
jgi:hypothetical protein